jgi:hypothetical protein
MIRDDTREHVVDDAVAHPLGQGVSNWSLGPTYVWRFD